MTLKLILKYQGPITAKPIFQKEKQMNKNRHVYYVLSKPIVKL
jgi:hypothetical protein